MTNNRPNCDEVAKHTHIMGTPERAIVELHRAVAALETRVEAVNGEYGVGIEKVILRVATLERQAAPVPAPAAAPAEVEAEAALVEEVAALIVRHALPAAHLPWAAAHVAAEEIRSALRAEGRLVEPGEIAALRAERDQARASLAIEEAAHKEDHRVLDGRVQRAEEEVRGWKARAEAAEKALDVERRTGIMRKYGDVLLERRVYSSVAERMSDARRVADENTDVRNERNALRAELAALKAKRVRRTRRVTTADLVALDAEYCKRGYGCEFSDQARAARAIGFRRVVQ